MAAMELKEKINKTKVREPLLDACRVLAPVDGRVFKLRSN
jgi:hypothetical protein